MSQLSFFYRHTTLVRSYILGMWQLRIRDFGMKDLAMRSHYIRQLQSVNVDLLRMGSRVEHALAHSMRALSEWDSRRAQQVIQEDREIDEARTAIEETVLEILATQQPVVGADLRTLNATIAIAGELERAGDYAKGISKRVIRSLQAPVLIETPGKLFRMGELAQQMLHTCLDAFVRVDVDMARSLAIEDELVDELEDEVTATLLDVARSETHTLDSVINLLDIAHTLERLADRSTNIAERVIFIATNHAEELNS
ncbi:MAG: phosphate signaling complex protein PhoU [Chloroflexota bacterium]